MDWRERYAAAWNTHDVEAPVASTASDCRCAEHNYWNPKDIAGLG
jgi:hypothetical protein